MRPTAAFCDLLVVRPRRILTLLCRLAAFALVFADMTNALFNPDNGTVLSDAERYLIYFGLLAGKS